MKGVISKRKKEIILFSVFILGAFLIVFHFTDTPKVWIDEGVFTEVAKNLAWHGVLGLQINPGNFFPMKGFLLSTSYPVIFPVAWSFTIFGTGIWQARLPMIIYMVILVVLFYLFTKKRYGFYAAILSVLMLISFSPFYGNGRPVQGEVPGLVFLILGSWLLLFWERDSFQNKNWALISGLAFGLAASTKPIYLLVIPMSLAVTLLFWIKKVKIRNTSLFIFGLGFLLPVFFWFFVHFSTVGSFLKDIPTYLYLAGNHGSSIPIARTVLTNFIRFFTESTPILFLLLLIATILSFLSRFIKKEERDFRASECLILSFIVLNWLGYLTGTGHYRYFFPAHTLLYLLFPAAILTLTRIVHKEVLRKIILAVPIVLIILQFFHLVFLSDTSFTTKRTRNAELSETLSKITPSQKVFFSVSPEAIIFLKGDNYSQYLAMEDFLKAGNENAFADPSLSFIVSRDNFQGNSSITCYDKKLVDRYFLFKKIKNCKTS